MAEKENEPPGKKRRLSLSLTKGKRTAVERFKKASDEEVNAALKGVVPDNTTKNNKWAANNFADWVKARESSSDEPVPKDLLSSTDTGVVCKWMCRFVMETRQESGLPYLPKSIYLLLCGLYRISRSNSVPFNFLDRKDIRFKDLHNTLDTMFSNLHAEGIGAEKKSASAITVEDEELLWEKELLSFDSPRSLQNLAFFYVGLHFALRGGEEQRDLKVAQFKRFPVETEKYDEQTCYEYVEFIAKNNQHRLKDIHGKNKRVKAYATPGSKKCVVKILDFYLSKLPSESKAFYLRPLEKVPSDDRSWYVNVPVGVNTLQSIIPKMCEKAGTSVRYTNHSLRATSASRLFASNIPEKVIQETTGHRSLAGLRAYEQTTVDQQRTVSI